MKMKKYFYPSLISVTLVLLICIFLFTKKTSTKSAKLKERTGDIALGGEWVDTKKVITSLLQEIELDEENYQAKLNLAKGYIQEGRITGDHSYYDAAALDLLDNVIENEPKNFDALCCKATVLLSQHHFFEALKIAKLAQQLNPNNAFLYGVMCDAYVELGHYKKAVKMSDKMISLRPDIRSYSRISYLREIFGDIDGAIYAAKLAVSSGYPGLEETAWSRIILAHLFELKGNKDSAEIQYRTCLFERKGYAFAYAGLGNLAKNKGMYSQAIQFYQKAEKSIIEFSFSDELTDLYSLNGNVSKSKKSSKKVIEILSPFGGNNESANAHGHYADKELSFAYLRVGNKSKALEHALIEYKRRPLNNEICELLAWVYYKNKEYKKAQKFIKLALKTKSKNPELMARAGLILYKAGNRNKGKEYLQASLKNDPVFTDIKLKKQVQSFL
jgi:tetratricopeptide (TPR) repeat protein